MPDFARAGLYGARIVQFLLAGIAAVLALGAADMNALEAVAVILYALTVAVFVLVVEFIVVRPLEGTASP